MAENTKIQWATHTWSPHRGCAKISPGCANCYAERGSHRNPGLFGVWGVNGNRVINADWDKPLAWDRKAAKLGERHRVFPSLCDPFEDREDLDGSRSRLLELISKTPNLDWLLLTKRPENWRPLMQRLANAGVSDGDCLAGDWLAGNPPANVWLGVSVENQEYADKRLPILLQIPAAIRWVSYEPALGLVDFKPHIWDIDWIVCGGESGPRARPFDLRWAEAARDQCKETDVLFFMKQAGSRPIMSSDEANPIKRAVCEKYNAGWIERHITDPKGGAIEEWPEDLRVREIPVVGATPAEIKKAEAKGMPLFDSTEKETGLE